MPAKKNNHTAIAAAPIPDDMRVRHYAGIALGVLFFSLLGIYLRPLEEMSVLWLSNAMLLGLFLRMPRLATPLGWSLAAIGYVTADLLTGSGLVLAVALSSVNLISVATALAVQWRVDSRTAQSWKEPGGLSSLFLAIVVASFAAGTAGGVVLWLLLNRPLWLNSANWIVAELLSYIIFLPCILSAPTPGMWRWRDRRRNGHGLVPLALLFASLLASVLIGGPGALAFPVIALLACALSYGMFLTSLLTMATSIWTLITITSGSMHDSVLAANDLLSIRLGVASVALAPIVVACVTAARESNLKTLRHMAEHDTLTDLLNRRTFRQRAQETLNRLGHQDKAVALLMIDIDHFKKVNDTHGHAAGDEVLRTIATRLRNAIRNEDLCARIGGEEFLVLIPECTPDLLRHIVQRIQQAFRSDIPLSDTAQLLSITASIGAVLGDAASTHLEAMMLKADQALYTSKEQGRNRASFIYDT